ncbi:5' nucleotidase, NT5C type [Tindallia californiensis]|uniref:Nucleotidase n=1 Tax=Tindallia californiensis TaxID=159292 RepID=A0A1H3M8I2_9FIRM|nr:hypothetical protein [Tindallia californiensis]SDY72529.1 hypothetical protein SAMN05192546_10423 [Tindallia californiensis]
MNIFSLTIGIDIDATLTEPYYWLPFTNEHFGLNQKPEDMTCYDLAVNLGISEEEYLAFYLEHGEKIHRHSPIRKEAPSILQDMYPTHQLYYITARHPNMEKVTKDWLNHHDIPQNGLFLLGSHDKVGKAQELRCDLFIEDRYENARAIAESGVDVLLMDCTYNRDQEMLPNMKRIENWYQVQDVISTMEKNRLTLKNL